MLNSLVRNTLVYSCQTWSTTMAQLNRMNAQYMSFIRKMTKGGYKRKDNSWHFVFTNMNLLEMAKTTDLTSYIRRQQRNYVGHVIRKENASIVKRLLFNSDMSRRPGRQTTLLSSVLSNVQGNPDELYTNAMNRVF